MQTVSLSWRTAALVLGLALPAVAQTAPAPNPAPDTVVARVNGSPVTAADLAVAADDPALSLPGVSDEQKKGLLVDYMVDLKLGAQAAEKAKVAESPDFTRKLAYFRDKLLLDEYLEREAKKAVTPEAARKLYDDTVKTLKPEEEVHARHILVDNEADAKKIAARIKGGEDFSKVAAETSKDPGSKAEGGDLGWFTKERMVPAFAEAAFKLDQGKVSDPVRTQFGWHVIKVEEKRTKPVPGFDEMKEQIDTYLTRKTQQDIITKLREQAKIEKTEAPAPAKPTEAKPTEAKPAEAK
ncbi:PpiC-type peptidyl-prolyl cis-trans isomerase [Methylobacterium sp. 4-46]|uniref:peptidylprolyl isomerase n=1 Tax=unclassified Methylobacterium TaxID=2615210 RepID=UPI000152C4BB|nr:MULTISPECIES: peptidylprolyl isomerase [Methylobacterium]ACA17026.1 PpiC-type peptidyl-prolyl cis-trans isomerase [Methylobacterium sp. 4-46]WFT82715.1 peptidylprolyl isomerase [Methylobacterium nodulans]